MLLLSTQDSGEYSDGKNKEKHKMRRWGGVFGIEILICGQVQVRKGMDEGFGSCPALNTILPAAGLQPWSVH